MVWSRLWRRPRFRAAVQIVRVADTAPAPGAAAQTAPPRGSNGDVFLRWFYYLHFGNFGDWQVKALWVVLGLAPPFLFVTGALMWWNRVLSREARASRQSALLPKLTSVAS